MDEFEIRQNLNYSNELKFQYEDDSDLIKLMFVKNYIESIDENIDVRSLIITYMPYSRMDRTENDSAFTLKYVCNFINGLNFRKVTVVEPHSDVTPALLNNCESKFVSVEIFNDVIREIGFDKSVDYVYSPDVTSHKRYSNKIGLGYKELIGIKNRDFATGQITSLSIIGQVNKPGFKVVMIDDLCSKGTTFQKGAEKLKEMGASKIYLVVGHCENTIHKGELLKSDLIDKIHTTDSILTNFDSDKLVVWRI